MAAVISDAWLGAVTETHRVVNRIEVRRLDADEMIAEYPILEGTVEITASDETHRSADITIGPDDAGNEIAPDEAGDIFAPMWCEVMIWSGIQYSDGTQELQPVGLFKVTKYELDSTDGGRTHRLTCYDRSVRARKSLGRTVNIPAGTPVDAAAVQLIRVKAPTLPIDIPILEDITPALAYDASDEAWKEAVALMHSSGYELRVNRVGVLVADLVKLTANPEPDWTFSENVRDVAWDVGRVLDSENVPNHVIIKSARSGSNVVGEAWDDDPLSPTWIKGPYGDVLLTESDPLINSNEQAERAAAAKLGRVLSEAETNEASVIVNQAVDPDDTVRLYRPSIGLDVNLLVDKISLPLTAVEAMQVTFRRSVITNHDLSLMGVVG